MRLLLDENLPRALAHALEAAGGDVTTVERSGWKGLSNGALLRAASAAGIEVLLTADRRLPGEHDLMALRLAVVVLEAHRTAPEIVVPLAPAVLALLPHVQPGGVYRLSA